MLKTARVMPTIPVVDLQRAMKFYEDRLGLVRARPATSDGIMYDCGGGTHVFLYPRAPSKADHTLASFIVDDVEAAVKSLRARGTEKAAWFKDSEGNMIAVSQLL